MYLGFNILFITEICDHNLLMKIYFLQENPKLPTLKIFLVTCNIINMHKKKGIIKKSS